MQNKVSPLDPFTEMKVFKLSPPKKKPTDGEVGALLGRKERGGRG